MPSHLGQETKTTFIKDFYGNDIFEELEAAEDIQKGAPIKLDADGKAVNFEAADTVDKLVGTSIHTRNTGEFITVATRFRAVQFCIANNVMTAGPASYVGYDASTDYHVYDEAAGATTTIGYCLDNAAAQGEVIRIGLL